MKKSISILFLLLIISGCAKKGFPPGGLEDKSPPEIVETKPLVGSLHVDLKSKIEVKFSEWVKPESVMDAVYISPYPGEKVKIKVSGKKLKIKLPESMKVNRTYVITLGTAIKDYRNNALKETFTLAFSTGSVLDQGEIEGQVFSDTPTRGLSIWAYLMEGELDPNPMEASPDYASQCNEAGEFNLTHMAPGQYRLFAIRDRMADRLYTPAEDEFGVSFKDVLLDTLQHLQASDVLFRMTVEDTIGPALERAGAITPQQVVLQFNEPIVLNPDSTDWVSITAVENPTDTLQVQGFYVDPIGDRRVVLRTDSMKLSTDYEAIVHHIEDKTGFSIDPEYRVYSFTSPESADTTRPFIMQVVPEPFSADIPLDQNIRILFNEIMEPSITPQLAVTDTSNMPVFGLTEWETPSSIRFQSFERWRSKQTFCLHLLSEGFTDLAGNPLPDSLWSFQALNQDTLTSISGAISDPDSTAIGPIFVTATQQGELPIKKTVRLEEPGPYHVKELLPGLYQLKAYRDEDQD
ncbi:Ig-like domain-containing protein, partial [candidate division KSB1 bacterium]|nr:Ig-like domain-containing protein [candidate division KSB1 bacterium]